MGDKLHGREGNSPDRRTKVPNHDAQWKGCGISLDSEDVGLEAATI
jgi:hypothetical protein